MSPGDTDFFLHLFYSISSKRVVSLDVTIDGLGLVSGSNDCSIRIWNIESQQCVRSLVLKGSCLVIVSAITQLFLFPWKQSQLVLSCS